MTHIPICGLQAPAECRHAVNTIHGRICNGSGIDAEVRSCPYRAVMELMPTYRPGNGPRFTDNDPDEESGSTPQPGILFQTMTQDDIFQEGDMWRTNSTDPWEPVDGFIGERVRSAGVQGLRPLKGPQP